MIQSDVAGSLTVGVNDQVAAQHGTWTYDRETLTEIAREWRALEEDCRSSLMISHSFEQVVPPGEDYKSAAAVFMVNSSDGEYLRMLGEMGVYAGAQADACEKALGTYEEVENENTSFFRSVIANIEDQQRASGGLL